MARPTVSTIVSSFARAAMDGINAAADAYAQRWTAINAQTVDVVIGEGKITIPAASLEPNSYPYAKRMKFETEIRVDVASKELEVSGGGRLFGQSASCIIEVVFTFGDIPEGVALHDETINRKLSQTLDQQ